MPWFILPIDQANQLIIGLPPSTWKPVSLSVCHVFTITAMKVQGHLRDYPLKDLFKILAHRHESGCLRIDFELQTALLYFDSGLFVGARIADLEGFPAIQMACSGGTAPFVFDNAIV